MRVGGFDIDSPRAVLVALALVTVVALVVAASTSTAAFGVYNRAWDGASDLRALADEAGAESETVRNTTAYGRVPPNGTVAVVLAPDEIYGPSEAARVEAFVEAGGTLVVADDFGTTANALLDDIGARARVDGGLLRDERYHYRSPAMPVAGNVSNRSLVSGVDDLTLNHGSPVRPNGSTVLVSTSAFAYVDANRNGRPDDDEELRTYPVATVEPLGDGRVVVVGDPSALINVMLERPGNRAFVRALFATHDRVLLDYSHAGLPPLAVAVLVLRESPALQLLVGMGGVAAIALWGRRPGWVADLRGRFGDRGRPDPPGMGREELIAFVERRHPGWDRERVERVVEGVLNDRD